MKQEDLARLFLEKAAKAGARCFWARSPEEFQELTQRILDPEALIYSPGMTFHEKSVHIPGHRRTEDLLKASVAIEEVSGGIAETGTIVCDSSSGKLLQASLLPEHHVAIVPLQRIYVDFRSFFASCSRMPANLTFITGPSRTADIEKTLVLGMHGPKKVTVIVM